MRNSVAFGMEIKNQKKIEILVSHSTRTRTPRIDTARRYTCPFIPGKASAEWFHGLLILNIDYLGMLHCALAGQGWMMTGRLIHIPH